MQEIQERQVQSLGWEDPLEEEMAPTPVFLPGKSHGQRRLADYSPKGCRVRHDQVTKATTYTHTYPKARSTFGSVSFLYSPTITSIHDYQ